MAASLSGVFNEDLQENINSCKLLVVGAGGIGCELLKDLVLTGFKDIDIIDLDTIDVSNLNRQFLFQKKHVGKSKAQVAQETAQVFNPDSKIRAHHDSIMSQDYGMDFFKQFNMVLNALDNRAARNHVNRMCLAADVPLIESGTAGYLGQVTVIKKGLTECYECQPKAAQKTFPGCTIRNTPSEPIHCIVWAKHLFNQLFGEADADEDVSPDTADPEAGGDAGEDAMQTEANSLGNVDRLSTRAWAVSTGYNPVAIFNKLFHDDIKYLLSMDKLWQKRRPPTPLVLTDLPDVNAGCSSDNSEVGIKDQRVWSVKESAQVLSECINQLSKKLTALSEGDILVWDKDDDLAMDFVTSCANIRAHIFGIQLKSRFDVKSMAGNIIPAIATTNAIIAGLIVMQAMQILEGRIQECKTVYLNRQPNPKNRLLVPCVLDKPNPKCYVCSNKPEVSLKVDVTTFTMKMLEDKVLKANLNMVAPDVEIDGKGVIVISSEEGETEENNNKTLEAMSIRHGTRLKCDDFLQNYELVVNIINCEKMEDGVEFEVIGDVSQLQAKPEEEKAGSSNGAGGEPVAGPSRVVDEEDDLILVDEVEASSVIPSPAKKRKASPEREDSSSKKMRPLQTEEDDDIVLL